MANLDDFLKIRNASSITTGTIDNARLPLDVKTAKIEVTNLIALYSLYNNQVQNGDIVAVNDIQSIFMVTDDTQLNNSSGYTLLVKPAAENISEIENLVKTDDYIVQVKGDTFVLRSPAQFKTDLVLVKGDVGLGNVANVDTTTTTNITDSTDKRFVTDAQLVVISNTSGTNTGDETQATIKTKLGAATTLVDGYLTTTDWNTFNGKQANITATTSADYYRGDKTFAALNKAAVGLGNVVNLDTSTATNITDSTNKRFVTDAQLVVIGNTTGTNTGDETQTTIKTKLGAATTLVDGYLTSTDWNTFNSKESTITATTSVDYYRGDKTFAALNKAAVGLGNVQNVDTSNASNISTGTLANARLTANLSDIGGITKTNDDIIQVKAGAYTNRTPAQFKTDLVLVKADVGLGNVVNLDTSTATNITDVLNKRFVTDAQLVVIGNTSGTNTGDETQATIKTKLGAATTLVDGYLTSTDWNTFNSKEPSIAATTSADYYRGDKTFAALNKAAVGLGNVDNTSDVNKPISSLTQTALNAKEPSVTATTSADYYRGDKTFAALNKTAVGLGNVANIDTSNASNISTGTLANARLTANLSDIGGITKINDDIIQVKLGVYTNRTPAQFKTDLVLVKADVGLGNVVNLDTTTTTNITSALNKRFVTDAQLVVIGNTSGTNTGDETQATIKTKLGAATTLVDGYLTTTDWNTFNSKQATAVNLTQISGITKTNDDIIQVKAGAYTNRTPAQFKTDLVLVKADVGLGNVVNLDTSTATNITSVLNKRFVTDAQLVVIGNTSGTNTGDETQATIKTKLGAATTLVDGYLTTTDWNTFNTKQANITATTSADYYRGDKTFAALDKAAVGLGNVDNTSDVNKPISSLTQTALNAKEPSVTATTSADYYRGDKTFAALDKTAVGLSNVANVDTTNASNISSGTLANARLSTNLTQIGDDTFANGEIIQSFGGTLQNAVLDVGTTGAVEITNTAGSILFDAPYAKGPLNQKSGFFEDFITYSATTISQILARTITGGGASTSIGTAGNSNDTRNGFIVFTTGTTSAGLAAVASGGLSNINFANIPVNGYEEFGARFQIPLVSDATQSFQIVAGFGDSASGLVPTDGAYISIGGGTVGFQGNTSSNSTRTNSGSLLTTVANTDYVIRIRVSNIAGTLSASYFVNGTQLGSAITTNIPSGAGRAMGIQFGIAKILGNTARTIELDWIYHESFKPRTINY